MHAAHACETLCSFGNHYPDRLHSRDAAYPNFGDNSEKDGNVLCGAMVSGPYAPEGEDGPVPGLTFY